MSVRWILVDRQGREHRLANLMTGEIRISEDAPADSAKADFYAPEGLPEGAFVKVFEGDRLLFEGPVDEQTRRWQPQQVTLQSRSRAAFLLDNEAKPGSLLYPSLERLWREYWKDLGFALPTGDTGVFPGEFVIRKGSSRWQVLEEFCRKYLGVQPRITPDGVIYAAGEREGEEVWINRGRLLWLKDQLRPRVLVSEIVSRTFSDGEYGVHTENEAAVRRGIRRVRYLNEAEGISGAQRSSQALLGQLNRGFHTAEIGCRGILPLELGDRLRVEGFREMIRVTGLRYQWKQGKECTVVQGEVMENVDG